MSTHVIHARPPRGPVGRLDLDRDPDHLARYLEDAASVPGGHAYAIVWPRTEADVAAVVSGAHAVLPIGAQSSLTGGDAASRLLRRRE
jgi:FAD/FMN-containing dehydrogenase